MLKVACITLFRINWAYEASCQLNYNYFIPHMYHISFIFLIKIHRREPCFCTFWFSRAKSGFTQYNSSFSIQSDLKQNKLRKRRKTPQEFSYTQFCPTRFKPGGFNRVLPRGGQNLPTLGLPHHYIKLHALNVLITLSGHYSFTPSFLWHPMYTYPVHVDLYKFKSIRAKPNF